MSQDHAIHVLGDRAGLSGGDELNILRAGRNYGRPLVSYGRDYLESPVSTHPFLEGMENPIVVWLPSISVTGMTFYTGELFPTGSGTCSSAVSARAAFRGSDKFSGSSSTIAGKNCGASQC